MGPAPGEVNCTAWSLTALTPLPDTALRVGKHNLGCGKAEAGIPGHPVDAWDPHRGVRNKAWGSTGHLEARIVGGPWDEDGV